MTFTLPSFADKKSSLSEKSRKKKKEKKRKMMNFLFLLSFTQDRKKTHASTGGEEESGKFLNQKGCLTCKWLANLSEEH